MHRRDVAIVQVRQDRHNRLFVYSLASRLLHWSFTIVFILLMFSGIYIHYPLLPGLLFPLGKSLFIHRIMAYSAMGIFIFWIYYVVVTGSYRHLLFRFRNVKELPGLIKYYLFWEQKLPPHEKYNAGQKLFFTSWVFVFVFQVISGLFLQFPAWANDVPPLTLQPIRYYHYLSALYFMLTVAIHTYLAFTEDPARFQAMLTGGIKPNS